MADMLQFKKGLLAALPTTKQAGTIYVTTDERAMYVDLDNSTRIRLGDFIEVATETILKTDVSLRPFSTTALYYVTEGNKLLKYTGVVDQQHNFIQINSTSTIATDLAALTNRVSANETAIGELQNEDDALAGLIAGNTTAIGNLTTTVANNKTAIEKTVSDLDKAYKAADTALDNRVTELETTVADIPDIYATKTELSQEVTDRTNAVKGVADRATALEGKVTILETTVGNAASGLVKKVADIEKVNSNQDTSIANLQSDLDAAEENIATNATNITTVTETAEQNKSDIATLTEAHNDLAGTVTTHGTDITNIKNKNNDQDTAISNLQTAVAKKAEQTALQSEIDRAKAAEKTLQDNIDTVDGKADDNAAEIVVIKEKNTEQDGRLTNLETAVTTIQDTYATDADLSSAVSTLEGKINKKADQTALNTTNTNVSNLTQTVADNKTELAGDIAANATAISDLQEAVAADKKDLSDYKTTVSDTYVTKNTYNTKMTALDNKDSDQDSRLSALENTVNTASTGLKDRVSALETASSSHAETLADHTDEIAALKTADTNLRTYIDDQFKAANSMRFMGSTTSLAALKDGSALTENPAQAGDTYVLTARDSEADAAIGDLFIAKVDGDNTQWTHVASGYVQDHEAELSGDDNKISLRSYTGANLGDITVSAKANTSVTVDVSDNAMVIGMEWGSF